MNGVNVDKIRITLHRAKQNIIAPFFHEVRYAHANMLKASIRI